eukprot:scaffold116384_cov53-Attheya_sp.AAC.5
MFFPFSVLDRVGVIHCKAPWTTFSYVRKEFEQIVVRQLRLRYRSSAEKGKGAEASEMVDDSLSLSHPDRAVAIQPSASHWHCMKDGRRTDSTAPLLYLPVGYVLTYLLVVVSTVISDVIAVQ